MDFDAAVRALALAATALGYAALLGGAGALLFACLFAGRSAGLARRIAGWGGLVGLVLQPVDLATDVLSLGGTWQALSDGQLWSLVGDTPSGTAAGIRATGFALVALGSAVPALRIAIGLPGLALALASVALDGHVAALVPAWPAQALLVVHLSGLAFWLGSLWPLLAAARGPRQDAAALMARFSRLATAVVPVATAAGLALAVWLVGGLEPLIGTLYGRILLAKLGLVAALLALAAVNKWRLVPALAAGDASAQARLSQAIRLETIVAVGVVAATAALTVLSGPPA